MKKLFLILAFLTIGNLFGQGYVKPVVSALPVDDATAVVKGSVDPTKFVRIEADGLSTGVVRIITMPDENVDLGSIVGKGGTKAQFDTALTNDNFAYIGQANVFTETQAILVNFTDTTLFGRDGDLVLQNTDGTNNNYTLIEHNSNAGTIAAGILFQTTNHGSNFGKIYFGSRSTTGWSNNSIVIDGNFVGINNNSPSEALDVTGNGLFSGTLNASNLSNTNTGDETDMNSISDSKANFDIALSDDDFAYQSDLDALGRLDTSSTITTSRDALLTDLDGINISTASSDITITIDSDMTGTFVTGDLLLYQRQGIGNITIAYNGTYAAQGSDTPTTFEDNQAITMRYEGGNNWSVINAPQNAFATATATGTDVDMSGLSQDNFGAASSAATFTMVKIAVGGYGEVLINKSGSAPLVTGATQFPNTATFIASTDMILCIKDFNGTRKYWFVEF